MPGGEIIGGGGAALRRLFKQPLTNVASVTVSGLALPEARIVFKGAGGMVAGSPCKIQFNGDTGNNYQSASNYVQGNSVVSGNAPGASSRDTAGQLALTASPASVAHLLVDITIWGTKEDGPPTYAGRFVSKGNADAVFIEGVNGGFWDQTAADVQSATIIFGANFTGNLWLFG